jgi:hypothetical protein
MLCSTALDPRKYAWALGLEHQEHENLLSPCPVTAESFDL